MDSQDIAILTRAQWCLKKNIETLQKRGRMNDAEELGRLVGLYYRVCEKLHPWPGQRIITKEVREAASKYDIDVSWACWNRGVYDDGTEGIPYVYVYLRHEADEGAINALCLDLDLGFYGLEESKPGQWFFSSEAVGGRWQKWWCELQGIYI